MFVRGKSCNLVQAAVSHSMLVHVSANLRLLSVVGHISSDCNRLPDGVDSASAL